MSLPPCEGGGWNAVVSCPAGSTADPAGYLFFGSQAIHVNIIIIHNIISSNIGPLQALSKTTNSRGAKKYGNFPYYLLINKVSSGICKTTGIGMSLESPEIGIGVEK
jgi:hypothetical protein